MSEGSRSQLAADDIYFARSPAGDLRTVILCNPEEIKSIDDAPQYHMVPQCQHKFVVERLNAIVSVNYRRVYLTDWRAIQGAWEKLLSSLVTEESTAVSATAKPMSATGS